jgi:hypothetical protein
MPIDLDTKENEEEDIILQDFNKLKESRFLKRHMAIFISCLSVLGFSAFFLPYLYAIVPVYETQQCKNFYIDPENNIVYPKLDKDSIVFTLNIYSYLLFNWLELLLMVLICFKIRNVKDELSIHRELLWIVGFWIMCSFCYFLFFSLPNFFSA